MNIQRLTDKEFRSLSTFIENSVGIRMPDNKRIMLEGRLNKRLRALKLESFHDYLTLAFSQEQRSGELLHMIDAITTNKTDFFRESDHFDYLRHHLLPGRFEDSDWGLRSPLRVWSTAASTGEEPYTLAIVLQEFAEKQHPFSYTILGTDISTEVLEKATRAVYTETKIMPVPDQLKRKYFLRSREHDRGLVRVKPVLRRRVSFVRLNLMQERYPMREQFEIIFGSSSISGERMTDAKEEVFVITKTIGDPLDHLDLVVHAFEDTGGETVSGVPYQALHVNG